MSVYVNRGQLVRALYAAVAGIAWLVTVGGRLRRCRTIVLCYHGVTSEQREHFEKQMRFIAHRAVDVSEAVSHGRRWLQPRICITFDDGFANLLHHALPTLQRLNVPAAIFAVSDNLGERPHWLRNTSHADRASMLLTAAQLRDLAVSPCITIGSHTHTHADLMQLTESETQTELSESKQALEAIAARPVQILALPHGRGDSTIFNIARRLGYQQVFTLDPVNDARAQGIVGRMVMTPDTSMFEFQLTCAGAYDWLPHIRSALRKLFGSNALESRTPLRLSRIRHPQPAPARQTSFP